MILALMALCASVSQVAALWPLPNNLQTGSSFTRLSRDFSIDLSVPRAPRDLTDAVSRTVNFLHRDELQRLVPDRGASDAKAISGAKELRTLKVSLVSGALTRSIAEEAQKPIGTRNEGYALSVPVDGSSATLRANSTLGLFHGLTTFAQLWYTTSDGKTIYATGLPMTTTDTPSFPYRGFMLDTARNFFAMDDIKRTLDAMSWVKLNTLHWHVVDSQSFPLQVPGFLEVSAKGAYASDMIYTPEDVKEIVAYAGARGIDVVPEIDTPGHTAIIAESHPEHIACSFAKPWATYANEPPAGQLRLASNATAEFTAGLLQSAASMFAGSLFSIGGDELNAQCYADDSETNSTMTQEGIDLDQALSRFTASSQVALQKEGKIPVVWEEMVLAHNVTTLSNDSVVMVWISSQNVKAVAEKGFRLVHAASDYFYLDCGAGEWIGADPDGNSWCDPFKTWQKTYTFDPLANLTESEQSLVLGGQHLLWAEQSGPQNLDSIAWPRACIAAELFWTESGARNVSSALPRLHDVRYRMVARGVQAIHLQPMWCAFRPELCDLTA